MADSSLAFETLDDFISKFHLQNQQYPTPNVNYLRLMVGQVAYHGVPLRVFDIKGVKHVLMFKKGKKSEYSLINLSQVDAITMSDNHHAVDALFKNSSEHYDLEAAPSCLEINNKLAALEIRFSGNPGPRKMQINWSSKTPDPAERFFVSAVLRQLEFFADVKSRPADAGFVKGVKDILIEFAESKHLQLSLDDQGHFCMVVGLKCKVSHIYQHIKNYLSSPLK